MGLANYAGTQIGAAGASRIAAAGGAGAAGAGGLMAWLGANPLTAFMLGLSGVQAIQQFLSGPTPYEQVTKQQLGAYQQMLPQLRAAAQGKPTAATQNAFTQLRQTTNQAQQSYASSAQGRNMGQTTPTMANQQRFRQAEIGAMGNIMGQSQTSAQQMLAGMGGNAMAVQRDVEMQKQQGYSSFLNSVAGIMSEQKRAKQIGAYTAAQEQMNQTWAWLFKEMMGGINKPATTPMNPGTTIPYFSPYSTSNTWVG